MPVEAEEPITVDEKKFETPYLFVYGGLKKGGAYQHALSDAKFIGEGMSRKAKYALFTPNDLWPALYKGTFRIKGEIYEVNPAIINRIDWVEGHPNLFTRVMFKIRGLKGLAYVYKASERLVKTYEDVKYDSDYIITNTRDNTQEWVLP